MRTLKPRVGKLPSRTATLQGGSWRGGKTSSQRGYDYRWQQYRKRYLAEHPLCVMCQAEDRVTQATVVDHVVPHRGDMTLFWRPGNHQALCAHHHSADKARQERAAGQR